MFILLFFTYPRQGLKWLSLHNLEIISMFSCYFTPFHKLWWFNFFNLCDNICQGYLSIYIYWNYLTKFQLQNLKWVHFKITILVGQLFCLDLRSTWQLIKTSLLLRNLSLQYILLKLLHKRKEWVRVISSWVFLYFLEVWGNMAELLWLDLIW